VSGLPRTSTGKILGVVDCDRLAKAAHFLAVKSHQSVCVRCGRSVNVR
jgi:hypothetical protein